MSAQLLAQAVQHHRYNNLSEAARLYRAVLQTDPRNFQALYLLGFVHFQWEKYEEAERLMGAAIAINPGQVDAHYNRGCALQKLKRDEDAVRSFDQALALNPRSAEALFNRGTSLLYLGRTAEALASFEAVLRLTPNDAEAWHNRGSALQTLRRFAEARASYARALALSPNMALAPGKLAYCKLQCCDWANLGDDVARILAALRAGQPAAGPIELMLIADSPEDVLLAARLTVQRDHPPAHDPMWRGERYAHPRIRVGYISPDFRAHAVAYQLAGIIDRHDRARFEIFGISHGADDGSAMRARLKTGFEHFVDMRGKSDPNVAAWLRQNEIDIAVDLSGHTQESRLSILAHRPAPLQISYLGYPGTTGAPYIDYLMADRVLIPDAERKHYGEKIAFLPDSFFPTDAACTVGPPPARASVGLPESAFVFCCFNPLCKLNPERFAVWTNLLLQVDGSVLWLPDQDEEARKHLRDAAGVDGARIVFAPFAPTRDEHLARLPLADLFLDTSPYNAHATASDALWMGVPVLTLPGRGFAARVAASLLGATGLGELVTASIAEYEAQALRLARNPALLAEIRARLHANRQTARLFDTARATTNLEAAYVHMWERWQRGEPPADFAIVQP